MRLCLWQFLSCQILCIGHCYNSYASARWADCVNLEASSVTVSSPYTLESEIADHWWKNHPDLLEKVAASLLTAASHVYPSQCKGQLLVALLWVSSLHVLPFIEPLWLIPSCSHHCSHIHPKSVL